MHTPAIRTATEADLPAIQAVTDRAYHKWIAVLGFLPLPMTTDYTPYVAAGNVRLLEVGGNLAGLMVVENPEGEDSQTRAMTFFSLAIDPDHQGKGYGRALLADAEDLARRRGAREARLYTNALMEENRRLYESLGYRETKRTPHPQRENATLIHMARTL